MSRATFLDQERIDSALQAIKEVKDQAKDPAVGSDYTAYVRALPAMIITAGLAPALSFLLSKAAGENDARGMLARHVARRVLQVAGVDSAGKDTSEDPATRCLRKIAAASSAEYRHWESEALAYVTWLKRLTEAQLGKRSKQMSE
ncbi:MAG: type III-B CRISPR module-associated protein Cmr5 [Acidobacterium ailaaui]|nr:type III-B CRISPR module-associated protein Cmr5 [Pseudacidobacterium ailaaui]